MDLMKIGKLLQELRREKELTQEQLAEQLGVARRTVSRWETGSNMPDLDVLMELSDFYDVGLREILNGERKRSSHRSSLRSGLAWRAGRSPAGRPAATCPTWTF